MSSSSSSSAPSTVTTAAAMASSSSAKRSFQDATDVNEAFAMRTRMDIRKLDFRPELTTAKSIVENVPADKQDFTLVMHMNLKRDGNTGQVTDAYIKLVTCAEFLRVDKLMRELAPGAMPPFVNAARIYLPFAAVGSFPKFTPLGNYIEAIPESRRDPKYHAETITKAKREARYSVHPIKETADSSCGRYNGPAFEAALILDKWQERLYNAASTNEVLSMLLHSARIGKTKQLAKDDIEYAGRNASSLTQEKLNEVPILKRIVNSRIYEIENDDQMEPVFRKLYDASLSRLQYPLLKVDVENDESYLNIRAKVARKFSDKVNAEKRSTLRTALCLPSDVAQYIEADVQFLVQPILMRVPSSDNKFQRIPLSQYELRRNDIFSPGLELSVSISHMYFGLVLSTFGMCIHSRASYSSRDPVSELASGMGIEVVEAGEDEIMEGDDLDTVSNLGSDADDEREPDLKRARVSNKN